MKEREFKKLDAKTEARVEAIHDEEYSGKVDDLLASPSFMEDGEKSAEAIERFNEPIEDTYDPSPEEAEVFFDSFDAYNELADLRSLPREEQKEKLEEIKETLDLQRRGISEIILALKKEIHLKSDSTFPELRDMVYKMALPFRLNLDQLNYFYNALETYVSRHKITKDFREKYKDDAEFFEVLFGFKPEGKVEVVTGPLTLHFRCYKDSDFLEACNFSSKKDENGKTAKVDLDRYGNADGVAFRYVKEKTLGHIVTAEKMSSSEVFGEYNEAKSLKLRIHEEQHQFNNLFEPIEWYSRLRVVMDSAMRAYKKDVWGAVNYVARWLAKENRTYTLGIDKRARDEILAFYREGEKLEEIYNRLTTYEGYDYFSEDKKETEKDLPVYINKIINDNIGIFYPLRPVNISAEDLRPIIDSVFTVEYKHDLQVWIDAIKSLEGKGYNREEIMSYIYQEPVGSWTRLARRIAPKNKVEKKVE